MHQRWGLCLQQWGFQPQQPQEQRQTLGPPLHPQRAQPQATLPPQQQAQLLSLTLHPPPLLPLAPRLSLSLSLSLSLLLALSLLLSLPLPLPRLPPQEEHRLWHQAPPQVLQLRPWSHHWPLQTRC
jgi:hypothetical protein